jgi:hypothetical protein
MCSFETILWGFVGGRFPGLGLVFAKMGGLCALTAVAAEGIFLLGARSMAAIQGKVASAAKYAFLALALVFAIAATICLGLAALLGTAHLIPCSIGLAFLAGFGVAAGTVPLHYRAFQWARAV